MDIYDQLVDGLGSKKPGNQTIETYLQSLQPSVRFLRKSYFDNPVCVPYDKVEIQGAYLVSYFPHYYQLIYSILNNEIGDLFRGKTKINLGFIGGGPGSEAYGSVKYILNNCRNVEEINITIFDLNASTWLYSHQIVLDYLIEPQKKNDLPEIKWNSVSFDLSKEYYPPNIIPIVKELDLLVVQNCINEIQHSARPILKKTLSRFFNMLPGKSCLLISDLTAGVRDLLKSIEEEIEKSGEVNFKISTLKKTNPTQQISVHAIPNYVIKKNLLTGEDGLIPRKNLKYDYTLLSKLVTEEDLLVENVGPTNGFMSLYAPLKNHRIDANNFVHTKSFIGLDFGTSTTVISVAYLDHENLVVKSVPIPQKDKEGSFYWDALVPTAMALSGKSNFMVGKHAAERKASMEFGKHIWYGFKENLQILPDLIFPDSTLKDNAQFKISNGKDALILFFKYLKKSLDNYLEENGFPKETEFSVTVPAEFEFVKKEMLRKCLIEAGIAYDEKPFIEEPTAALINYLFESMDPIELEDDSKTFLILDVGAGTVDVSVLRLEKEMEGISSKLLAVSRKGNVGGNLLDEYLAKIISGGQNDFDNMSDGDKKIILKEAENLKIKLCKDIQLDSTNNFKLPNKAFGEEKVTIGNHSVTFFDFYNLMKKYWEDLVGTIEGALKKSSQPSWDIDSLILNGGGSRNPYIQSFIRDYFDKSEIIKPDNIQEHVSRGAALNSFVLNSYGKQIVSNILRTPILVHEEEGDRWVEIIKEGELLPTEEVKLDTKRVVHKLTNLLQVKYNDQVATFLVSKEVNPKELAIFINIDNEPECEIIFDEGTQKVQRL